MNKESLSKLWLHEETIAHIHGWDFSHIEGRYEAEHDLPWNYEKIVRYYLQPEMKLLDMDTGGGKFPGFNVKDCLGNLYHAQSILEQHGVIEGQIHRFLLVTKKC